MIRVPHDNWLLFTVCITHTFAAFAAGGVGKGKDDMSTIYTFHVELPTLATPASGDRLLVSDISGGDKNDITLAVAAAAAKGIAATDKVGFYGVTPVDQASFTAAAITAITTNPTFSASNTGAGVFGFASQTVANAYVTRVQQMQADLDTLMARINSTGFINITGL